MASKAVATAADVSATAGTVPVTGSTGTWTAGAIQVTTCDAVRTGGQIIREASCTFSYSGTTTSTPSSPVTATEDVKLTAATTVLTCGQPVLVDGDKKVGAHGNQLKVASGRPLRTG
jgi:hypothetical protein